MLRETCSVGLRVLDLRLLKEFISVVFLASCLGHLLSNLIDCYD